MRAAAHSPLALTVERLSSSWLLRCFDIVLVVLNVTGLLLLPDRLILEITESGLMADQERAIRTVTRVHELGMGVSIDDFGSGYSSIAYLRRLHSTEVKMRAPCLDFRRADLADARPE